MLQVPADQVSDRTQPADLARWDSMQHLILVSAFEEEFGLDLDPEEAIDMYKDFATFRGVVQQKLASRQ